MRQRSFAKIRRTDLPYGGWARPGVDAKRPGAVLLQPVPGRYRDQRCATTSTGTHQRNSVLHCDPVAARMKIVERRTEIAVRITRNAATILTIALGAVLTGLWSLHQIVDLFR